MKEVLVDKSICLQLTNERFLAYDTLLKERKLGIDPIIGHRTNDNVEIVSKTINHTVSQHEINPILVGRLKNLDIQIGRASCRERVWQLV